MPSVRAAEIAAWSDPGQQTTLSFEAALHAFHTFGPRVRFIKTLVHGAKMLDAGAGDGGTLVLRDWPAPARPDIRMYAWAAEEGAGFKRYAGSEVGFWPQDPPRFGGMAFDAILAANFIEHIDDPLRFVAWASGVLAPSGRIFLEWPRPESIDLPTFADLATCGVKVTTGAYHDDATHRSAPPDLNAVTGALRENGLRIVESGIASVPFIDQQVAIHARRNNDITAMTLSYWSYTGWTHFLIAERET